MYHHCTLSIFFVHRKRKVSQQRNELKWRPENHYSALQTLLSAPLTTKIDLALPKRIIRLLSSPFHPFVFDAQRGAGRVGSATAVNCVCACDILLVRTPKTLERRASAAYPRQSVVPEPEKARPVRRDAGRGVNFRERQCQTQDRIGWMDLSFVEEEVSD